MSTLLVLLLDFFGSTADITHVAMECLLHGSKTVLKKPNIVIQICNWYLFIIMTFGNELGITQKLVDRLDRLTYYPLAQPQHDEQTNNDKGNDNVSQTMVTQENFSIRTYHGKAPLGSCYLMIVHMIMFAIDIDMHGTLLAFCHLVA